MTQNVNPRLTPELEAELYRHHVEVFNQKFPVGTPVWHYSTIPMGPVYETSIRQPAQVPDSLSPNPGQPVVWLEGISGYVLMTHVMAIVESERNRLNPVQVNAPAVVQVVQAKRMSHRAMDAIKEWEQPCIPGFGDREFLARAAELFRDAADSAEQAYRELEG